MSTGRAQSFAKLVFGSQSPSSKVASVAFHPLTLQCAVTCGTDEVGIYDQLPPQLPPRVYRPLASKRGTVITSMAATADYIALAFSNPTGDIYLIAWSDGRTLGTVNATNGSVNAARIASYVVPFPLLNSVITSCAHSIANILFNRTSNSVDVVDAVIPKPGMRDEETVGFVRCSETRDVTAVITITGFMGRPYRKPDRITFVHWEALSGEEQRALPFEPLQSHFVCGTFRNKRTATFAAVLSSGDLMCIDSHTNVTAVVVTALKSFGGSVQHVVTVDDLLVCATDAQVALILDWSTLCVSRVVQLRSTPTAFNALLSWTGSKLSLHLIIGTKDGAVHVVDGQDGALSAVLRGHSRGATVHCVRLRPGPLAIGDRSVAVFASTADDGATRLWSLPLH